ncbi:MAG: serine/threonine protein kinase [Planctomycetota bacterium]|nr:serine/threonine protein kinase [Planctomycetota bacterium]
MASPPNPEPFKTVAVKLGLLTKAKAEQAHRLQIHVAQTLDLPKDFLEICEQKGMLSAEQIKKVREEVARRAAKASGSRNEVTKEKLRELAGFEILEKIGQGAMGAVFKVRQKSLDRIVALKILPPSLAKNKQFVERFVREARASAALNHPNIVQGIDVGEDKGVNYFAMEYIDGETVHERFKREGPLPVKDVLEIGRQTALALAHAHTRNLIHRDIKPANLMLLKPGSASQGLTVKVMDLGLARALEDEDGHRTEAGSALGTPFYLSPEQARGESNLSGACDLYCLGGTLYHLLTGKPPYEGESSAVIMTKHIGEPVPDPKKLRADLEPEVCEIVRKLMAKKPEERYPNAQALADDLGLVLAGDTPKHIKLKGLRGKSTGPVGAVTGKHGTTGPRGRVTTKGAGAVGPRKRDGEGETGPRTASASKSFPVLPVAVGGVALLALLGVLLSSSSGKPADPAKSSPDQASTENRTDTQPAPNPEGAEKQRQLEERRQAEAEAQRKLDELKSKAEQVAAGDLEALELAWSELRRSAGDHAYAKLANDKLKEIGELKAAAAAKAVERLIGEAGALAGQGDFDAALAHLAAADGKLAGNGELKAALDNAAQELAARGQEAGAKPLQAAADLAAAGKLEEAVGAYEAASRFKYQPVAKEAAAKLEAVRGQIAQAQAAAAEAARQKLFGLAKSVAELVRQRKTDEAQAEVRRALNDAELRPAQELLRLLPEAFDGVADLNRMAAARLVGHEEKGLVFPENDRVYYKIENERLYYRPKPDFPQVTNTRLDGVEWPDLLFLAGLRGGDVMAVLNAVPLERAEMLGDSWRCLARRKRRRRSSSGGFSTARTRPRSA